MNLHVRKGRCKGKSDSQKFTELEETIKDKDEEIEQLTVANSNFATMKQDHDEALKENTLLLKENKQLTIENAGLLETQSQLRIQLQELSFGRSSIRQIFKFEVADMHLRGNYMVETFGISLDVPVDIRCIITKQGRAVEQSIADRSYDTLRKHPDNRIMCIKHCKDPGEAERNFKRMTRGFKMLKSGTFPDFRNWILYVNTCLKDASCKFKRNPLRADFVWLELHAERSAPLQSVVMPSIKGNKSSSLLVEMV